MFDLLLNYGLLMRFAANVSLAYYLVKPSELFDSTLPAEGQKFPGNMSAVFAKHCLDAQKKEALIMGAWFLTVIMVVFIRFVVVFYNKMCLKQLPKPHSKHLPKSILSIISFSTVLFFIYYLNSFDGDKFDDMVPAHWYFYRTSIKQEMSSNLYMSSLTKLRSKYVLPEGEEWLD